MKKLVLSLIAVATTLAAAETFESDGIWYKTKDDNTVTIIKPEDGRPYAGKITIVPEVTHDGKTHVGWFRRKKDEFMDALGLPTRKQNRGIKL